LGGSLEGLIHQGRRRKLGDPRRIDDRVDRDVRRFVEPLGEPNILRARRGGSRQKPGEGALEGVHRCSSTTMAELVVPKSVSTTRGAVGSATQRLSSTTNE